MKTLYLVRHGKAESRDVEKPDYERILAEQGIRDSLNVAKRLSGKAKKPDLIVTSPAPRSLETAKLFARQLGYKVKRIIQRKSLYDQSESAIADIVAGTDDMHDTLMIVGHNPSIEEYIRLLVPEFKEALSTCGVVGIEFDISSWRDAAEGMGKLILVDSPLFDTPRGSTRRKDIETVLADCIHSTLSVIHSDAAAKITKTTQEIARELAKKFVKERKKLEQK